MRKLIVLFLLISGCATIVVPNTPEGMSCLRECQFLANQCIASTNPDGQHGLASLGCIPQNHNCQLTCPGAYEE